MPECVNTKIDLSEMTVPDSRQEELLRLFPEATIEGKIDFARLRQALGDAVDLRKEKYGLSWAGKSEAIQVLQTSATGTLVPMPEESVNFETSENLIIEGDNLEVLKLLQKSYYGKVKMIYIDPPYNTGNEFIYPDNFKEGLDDYLKYSGQTSEDGLKLSTNTELDGRYHSKWLSMMYPRIFLAKNLLRQDGVVFVSIDDNEVHNLRALMNEIFGEENFVTTVIWEKRYSPQNAVKWFSEAHDFVLVYAKNKENWFPNLLERTDDMNARYRNLDNDPRGVWKPADATAQAGHGTKSQFYELTAPSGKKHTLPNGRCWVYTEDVFQKMVADNRIWFGADGNNVPAVKKFLTEVKQGTACQTIWKYSEVGHNQEGKKEVNELFPEAAVFETPKPVRLLKRALHLATDSDSIVLDFFAGSASTAQAVIEMNQEDDGNRKFVLVQLPEIISPDSPAFEVGYRNIAEIAKERVRRVIQRITDTSVKTPKLGQPALNLGFKAFKLSSSNFKEWRQEDNNTGDEAFAQQLRLHIENVKDQRGALDIVYEISLKLGYELSVAIEQITLVKQSVYSIACGEFLLCVEKTIAPETLREMMKRKPKRVMCLDVAFVGNDTLKTNIVLEMQSHSIEFHTV